jgi:hypothetical protein
MERARFQVFGPVHRNDRSFAVQKYVEMRASAALLERRAQRFQLPDQVLRFHIYIISDFAYFDNTEKPPFFIKLSATFMFCR